MYVNSEIFKQRIDICSNCEFFNKVNFSCLECGCPVEDICLHSHLSCPKNKWSQYEGENSKEFIDLNIINEINRLKKS